MNTVPAIHVRAPKVGNFYFSPEEWEVMRGMEQWQLIEKLTTDFEELSTDDIVYVTNHVQVSFLVK